MQPFITRHKYRDTYGCEANLSKYRDGSARLVVYLYTGKVIHDKKYRSFRGARIAMGKLSDCWTEMKL